MGEGVSGKGQWAFQFSSLLSYIFSFDLWLKETTTRGFQNWLQELKELVKLISL